MPTHKLPALCFLTWRREKEQSWIADRFCYLGVLFNPQGYSGGRLVFFVVDNLGLRCLRSARIREQKTAPVRVPRLVILLGTSLGPPEEPDKLDMRSRVMRWGLYASLGQTCGAFCTARLFSHAVRKDTLQTPIGSYLKE